MPCILVIDDDPTIRLVLTRALKNQGYEVIAAASGKDGVQQAKQHGPALIICDWIMPEMDGLEVCREIRHESCLSTTFFILLTAKDDVADRVKGLEGGADEFLAKPVDISELRARVKAGLRLHQLSQDLQKQKQLLETELTEAADYVRSLLPSPLTGSISIDTRFLPSSRLGGDCFDYYWLDPDFLVTYLLDVSGNGVGAALLSISVLNLLRSQSLPNVNFYQPQNVLQALNETFQMDRQNKKFFTIWYGVYNRAKRQLRYASAGHPPAVLITAEAGVRQLSRLPATGPPIGMIEDVNYQCDRLDVPSNSTLYVFSDGLYEGETNAQDIDGLESFVTLINQQPPHASLDKLLVPAHDANQTACNHDDLSLMRIHFD